MEKRLIDYIRDKDEAHYANISDWMKELRYENDYNRVEILCGLLLHIENQEEMEIRKKKELENKGDLSNE